MVASLVPLKEMMLVVATVASLVALLDLSDCLLVGWLVDLMAA